jgi:nitroimidazol reductase NimA-like FMN-containing flavoprotein (pyridoxamine 5'-phosphate oxidase superfamily)
LDVVGSDARSELPSADRGESPVVACPWAGPATVRREHAQVMDETTNELTPRECWDLLASSDVGRLAVCFEGGPDVFPINYVVANGTLIFRTAPGLKHVSARLGEYVALEADHVDRESGMVWSVVAKGRARDVTGEPELAYARSLPLRPMHDSRKSFFVRLEPDTVTGRQFQIAPAERWIDEDGKATKD